MQRRLIFAEGEYYHLYNRGNSKQAIFLDDQDRSRFVKMLYLANSEKSVNFREDIVKKKLDIWDFDRGEPIVSIGAWVLMPNHFHLLLTINPKSDFGQDENKDSKGRKRNPISVFMQKVFTSYSKYFNKKHERTGGLFETSFKSSYIDSDKYLKYVFSYIHLNPVKIIDSKWKESGIVDIEKAKKFLDDFKWSSYPDYYGTQRTEGMILSPKDFPEYFDNPKSVKKEIFDWLSFSPKSDFGQVA